MSYSLQCRGTRHTTAGEILATVVLVDESGVDLFSDRVNLTLIRSRGQFAKELLKRFPDLKGQDLEGQLLELMRKIPPDQGRDSAERVPQAQVLVALARRDGHEFFHDGQTPFVAMERDGHREIWPIRSQNYKRWLGRSYWEAEDEKVPNQEALSAALNVLEGFAVFDGPEHKLGNRVTWHNEELWYDLTDATWRAVRVSPKGWEVVDKPPILFQRHNHQLPQVTPSQGGDPKAIIKFLRPVNESETVLLLAYIGSCFIPDIPHPIPIVHGDPGSGKSTRLRLMRQLLDPSELPLLSLPRDAQAAVQLLSHHWIAYFDNVSFFPDWISDLLCRACTGEGSSKRQLWTDDEDVIYSFRRCVGLNGINIVTDKPDLLDRTLLLRQERIGEKELLEDSELFKAFKKELPAILGGFLDAMSRAMAIKPEVNLPWRSRMVDFVVWGAAIARALDYTEAQFLQAYSENIQAQNQTALAASLVAQAIMKFMVDNDSWTGTPGELLAALEPVADSLKINTKERGWPKNPTWLTRRINEVRVNILAEGISVLDNRADKRGVTLLKMPKNSVISDGRQEIGMAPDTTLNLNDSVRLPSLDSEFTDGKGYPVTKMTLSEKDSDVSGSEPTVTNDTIFAIISEMEGHLGMTVHQALALWQSAGAPVIYLSQGVNCLDLGKLLSRTDVSAEHLEALKIWLQEHKAGGQGK
jgi:hypothetical protein